MSPFCIVDKLFTLVGTLLKLSSKQLKVGSPPNLPHRVKYFMNLSCNFCPMPVYKTDTTNKNNLLGRDNKLKSFPHVLFRTFTAPHQRCDGKFNSSLSAILCYCLCFHAMKGCPSSRGFQTGPNNGTVAL